ncbi:MAG: DNA polymerase III subunit beta [Deltaproteobacteria bacterium]|nr:DNA polymerase III subunit beta [Deltaproteobacteria bacterium]MBW2071365.1 DNA polymerase III subunit beta [Deltaproteobacteria bacterium]
MEFTIQKEDFLKGLQKAQSVAEKRSSMPILSNVLIEAKEDAIQLTATDLEVSFTGKYPAQIFAQGAITVQARKFYEIVKELPAAEIKVTEKENQWLHISSANSEFNLVGLPPDQFPQVARHDELPWISMDSPLLKDMIDRTIFAVSTEETRYNLAGIYFEKIFAEEKATGLRLVATDGHRLSMMERPLENIEQFPFQKGAIVPRKGMYEVSRLLEEAAEVKVAFDDNNAVFQLAETSLVVRLIDGDFPDYSTVIPREFKITLEIEREKFMEMLKRMIIISTDRYRGIRCNITEGSIEIISNNPEIGDAREQMPIAYYGDDMTIAFNPRYFLDALSVMSSEKITINMVDQSSACIISGNDDEGYCAIVMPMRLE